MSESKQDEYLQLLVQSSTESTLAVANYVRTVLLSVGYGVAVAFLWSLGGTLRVGNELYCQSNYSACELIMPEFLASLSGLWGLPFFFALLVLVVGLFHLGWAYSEATRFRKMASATVSIDD